MSADLSLLHGLTPPHGTPVLQETGHFDIDWSGYIDQVHRRVKVTLPNTGYAVSGIQSTGLISLPAIQDTRANRVKYDPGAYIGWLYYETDSGSFYISGLLSNVPLWIFASGGSRVTQAGIPVASTLSYLDAGYTVEVLDYNHRLTWEKDAVTNAAWAAGTATVTLSQLPPWIVGQTVVIENILPAGYNGAVVLTGVTATTVTYAVANPGAYVSGGTISGWTWAAGERGSGEGPVFFEVDPNPTTGWHLYDGTANVPYLKSDGTTGLVTLPDLTSAANKAAYPKAGSPNGGPNAAVVPTVGGGGAATGASATGISNPANTGSTTEGAGGNNSASVAVQSGAGTTVAANTHTHTGAAHTHTIGAPTDPTHTHTLTATTVAADGEPRNLVRRPWFRC